MMNLKHTPSLKQAPHLVISCNKSNEQANFNYETKPKIYSEAYQYPICRHAFIFYSEDKDAKKPIKCPECHGIIKRPKHIINNIKNKL